MGIIYLATSPSGKSYVGQTTKPTIEARWAEHVSEAKGSKDYSWRLNRAIRKYNSDGFAFMTLWLCNDTELDAWEEYFIELFGTLMPHGYNLSKGGKNGFAYTPEVRTKMSKSQRRHICEEWKLPMYMYYYPGRGFGVRPPGKTLQRFKSQNQTMEEKYEHALNALAHPENIPDYTPKPRPIQIKKPRAEWNLGKPRQSQEASDLPRYVTYLATNNVIRVQKPGHPVKTFGNKQVPLETRKKLAIEYLNSLN